MINYPPIPTLYVMYVDIMSDKFVDGVLRQAPLFKYRLKRALRSQGRKEELNNDCMFHPKDLFGRVAS